MAEFWSNIDRGYRLRLWLDEVSTDKVANTSQVRVRLALLNTYYTFTGYSLSAYVDINNNRLTWSGSPAMLSNNSVIELIDRTITVPHNDDGSKVIGFIAHLQGGGGYSPNNLDIGSNAFQLTKLDRASTISPVNATIGAAVSIPLNKANQRYVHSLRLEWYGKTYNLFDKSNESTFNVRFSNNLANDLQGNTSGSGKLILSTYDGNTFVASYETTITLSVPTENSEFKPIYRGITLAEGNQTVKNALTLNNTTFIQTLSQIQVLGINAEAQQGASISSIVATIEETQSTVDSVGGMFAPINRSGEVTIKSYVVDSRGAKSDTRRDKITILPYFAPSLTFDITRTGTNSDTLVVNRTAAIAPLRVDNVQKNTFELTFKVDNATNNGAASMTSSTISELVNSNANLSGTFQPTRSYTVLGILSDKFTRTEFSFVVSTEAVVMSYDKVGRVGIGKVANDTIKERSLDVAKDVYVGEDLYIGGVKYVAPTRHFDLVPATGVSLNYSKGDIDAVKWAGLFGATTLAHLPDKAGLVGASSDNYLRVIKVSANNIFQELTDRNGAASWVRNFDGSKWSDWVMTYKKPLDWTSTGVSGVYYKEVNGIVYLSLSDFRTENGRNMSLGTIPTSLLPRGEKSMLSLTAWTANKTYHYNLQINNDGSLGILAESFPQAYSISTQVSWAI